MERDQSDSYPKAVYDADHHCLYVYLRHIEPGEVAHTEEVLGSRDPRVLLDRAGDGEKLGYEFLLGGPIEVGSGDSGGTKTMPSPGTPVPIVIKGGIA